MPIVWVIRKHTEQSLYPIDCVESTKTDAFARRICNNYQASTLAEKFEFSENGKSSQNYCKTLFSISTMFSTVASILVAIWCYRSSLSVGENPFKWTAIGIVAFYVTMYIWSSLILKPLMGREFYQHSIGVALTIELSSVVIGVAAIAFLRWKLMARKTD